MATDSLNACPSVDSAFSFWTSDIEARFYLDLDKLPQLLWTSTSISKAAGPLHLWDIQLYWKLKFFFDGVI